MENATTFYERLELAMKRAKCNRETLRKATGITSASLRQLKLGGPDALARADRCIRAATFLRVNPAWLILGEGEMELAPGAWPFDNITPAQWEAIPPDSRRILQDVIRVYANRVVRRGTK